MNGHPETASVLLAADADMDLQDKEVGKLTAVVHCVPMFYNVI